MTLLRCCISTHLTFQVSQGSAAKDLRWGENFNKLLFHSSFLNIVVKKLRKSVSICQSYRKNKSGTFFYGPRCIYVLNVGKSWPFLRCRGCSRNDRMERGTSPSVRNLHYTPLDVLSRNTGRSYCPYVHNTHHSTVSFIVCLLGSVKNSCRRKTAMF